MLCGGEAVTFEEVLNEAVAMLQRQGRVSYRVTSGGSAVEEILAGGTPHEMVTMYHLDGPRLLDAHKNRDRHE